MSQNFLFEVIISFIMGIIALAVLYSLIWYYLIKQANIKD